QDGSETVLSGKKNISWIIRWRTRGTVSALAWRPLLRLLRRKGIVSAVESPAECCGRARWPRARRCRANAGALGVLLRAGKRRGCSLFYDPTKRARGNARRVELEAKRVPRGRSPVIMQ